MGAIPRRMPSANHKAYHEAVYEAVYEAFHSEYSTSPNHVTAEEETQPEDSSTI